MLSQLESTVQSTQYAYDVVVRWTVCEEWWGLELSAE